MTKAILYQVVAWRIIDAARSGERDPKKLKDIALRGLGDARR
jgi:hypothetical protein